MWRKPCDAIFQRWRQPGPSSIGCILHVLGKRLPASAASRITNRRVRIVEPGGAQWQRHGEHACWRMEEKHHKERLQGTERQR